MQISKDSSGVLQISGVLEIRNADELHKALREFVENEACPVIDVASVEGCDAAALQLFCSARKTAAARGKVFRLTGVPEVIQEAAASLGIAIEEVAGAV